MSDEVTQQMQELQTDDSNQSPESSKPPRTHQIALFVKAGSDRECIGCCPFSQRIFMILWLKGVVFNVTTVDKSTIPQKLRDLAPGTNPPFLMFNEELLTDISKCEDYIEAELYPPHYPKLSCKYSESNTIGSNIFAKFSAFVKYKGDLRSPDARKLSERLVDELRKLDAYLRRPLDHEIDADSEDNEEESKRNFIDGNFMTLADCNMLPKLNIIQVAGKAFADFEIPAEFVGIHRYLRAAHEADEFKQTCPADYEICFTYGLRGGRPHAHKK